MPAKLPQPKWKWAKLPVRYGGLGLQDLPLVSLAAFMAAMGAVARMATRAGECSPACIAPKVVRACTNSVGKAATFATASSRQIQAADNLEDFLQGR